LAFDNVARAALETGKHLRVLLVGEDDPFLESALKADPAIAVEILKPESWRSNMGADFDAVVFDNWLPQSATLETLGRGAFFFFGRAPFSLAGEEIPPDFLEVTESGSPLLWNVELDDIRLAKAGKLAVPSDGHWRASVPIQTAGEPLVIALEGPKNARAVAVAFSVADSNFPLRVGFPLFVSNVIHWLAGRFSIEEPALKAGETFFPAQGEKVSRNPLREAAAAGEGTTPSLAETPVTLRRNGFYEVRGPLRTRWLAVNTENAAESDLRAAASDSKIPILGRNWGAWQPWRWLALGAVILLVAEWCLHHRRVTE
jgi:hypothetical protein